MPQFTVIVYEKENGESPVEDFINGLEVKMRAKVYGLLSILQDKGNMLWEPTASILMTEYLNYAVKQEAISPEFCISSTMREL